MKTKVQLKNLYLIAIIAIGLIGLGVGSTFAMFTASTSIDNPIAFSSNLSSTNNLAETIEVVVPAREDKYVDLVISNTNANSLNYNVWYTPSSNDLEVGSESSNNSYGPAGILPTATNFTLTVQLRNNGDSPITVTIGLSSSGDTIVLPSGVTSVPDNPLPSKAFYDILKNVAEEGKFAKKYNGNHQDSVDSSKSTEDIYYFYADTDENGITVRNMNNVVFGNQCWIIIRTTDTGGTRLLYNGEPTITVENGKTKYDCGNNRPGHIGGIKSTQNLSGSYYYAKEYSTSLSGTTTTFALVNPKQIEVTSSNAEEKIAEIAANYPFTCKKTTSDETCAGTSFYKILDRTSGTNASVYASVADRDNLGARVFNSNYTSPADVGYMNNIRYSPWNVGISTNTTMLISVQLTDNNLTTYGNYYFGNSYFRRGGYHDLVNPQKGNTVENGTLGWENMYLCQSSTSSSCPTMYYVADVDSENNVMYLLSIASGKDLNNYNYLFGDDIVDNGDGTFSLTGNVYEINASEWKEDYNQRLNKYVCIPGYYTFDSSTGDNVCSDNGTSRIGVLEYITYVDAVKFIATNIYKYGYGIELDSGNNYKLVGKGNDKQTLKYINNWPSKATTNCFSDDDDEISECGYQTLSRSHYSCFNLSGECSTYYYIIYSNASNVYAPAISDGKYVSTDLSDPNNILYLMLYQNDANGNVNTNNSTIKGTLDEWYKYTLLDDFDKYIEDTVFCNNREITSIGGWNPDGGNTYSGYGINFKESSLGTAADLSCSYITDMFSTSNPSAKLTYNVGLMSKSENILLNRALMYFTSEFESISPATFSNYSAGSYYFTPNGRKESNGVHYGKAVRPYISLKPGVKYSSGKGEMIDPYIVDYNQ